MDLWGCAFRNEKTPWCKTINNRIVEWALKAPTLLCNLKFGGCFEAPDEIDTPPIEESPSSVVDVRPVIVKTPDNFSPYGIEIIKLAAELDLKVTDVPTGYRVVSAGNLNSASQ